MKIAMVIVLGIVIIVAILAAATVVINATNEKEESYRRELELAEQKNKDNYRRNN